MKPKKKTYITNYPETFVNNGITYIMTDPAAQNNMSTRRMMGWVYRLEFSRTLVVVRAQGYAWHDLMYSMNRAE
jgi:hypothetical protein